MHVAIVKIQLVYLVMYACWDLSDNNYNVKLSTYIPTMHAFTIYPNSISHDQAAFSHFSLYVWGEEGSSIIVQDVPSDVSSLTVLVMMLF